MTTRRSYSRHGLHPLKRRVMVDGLASLDRRSVAARALLDWRSELIAALGGEDSVTPQQTALVELAVRTRLYIDHLDAFLMAQRSLVNAKRKAVLPVLRERQQLADSLARLLGQVGLERRVKMLDLAQALSARPRPSDGAHDDQARSDDHAAAVTHSGALGTGEVMQSGCTARLEALGARVRSRELTLAEALSQARQGPPGSPTVAATHINNPQAPPADPSNFGVPLATSTPGEPSPEEGATGG